MNNNIHATAAVSADAHLAPRVQVGPYAVIEGNVHIGEGTVIGPHAVIREFSRIGADNRIDAHAVIGGAPQYLGHDGSETWVEIGDGNVLREFVTVNRSIDASQPTRVGNRCFLMASSHVAHDCQIGDHVILTNTVLLAGHIEIGHHAVIGGLTGCHQFLRVGAYSMVAGMTPLRKDVLPFMLAGGDPVRHVRLNSIGLRRNGIAGERYQTLQKAFRQMRKGDMSLDALPETEELGLLKAAIANRSKFGVYGFTRERGDE